jgi:signal transduction histidine kinase
VKLKSARAITLRKLVLLSWVIPGVLVVCASLIAFLAAGWVDYQNSNNRIRDDLTAQARVVSRRLSAELLLGSSGAPDSVAKMFESELGLSAIKVYPGEPKCAHGAIETCSERSGSTWTVFRKIELVKDPHYVAIKQATASFARSLHPWLFLWSAVPVALLLALGLAFQRRLLARHVIDPIASLVDTTVHAKTPPSEWPLELQDISHRLARSFEERDQAVFGRVAGGVIHDIKTLLQSVRSSMELARELPQDSPKRASRLEGLLKATSINVPKMLGIIELTLDGNREIPIRHGDGDLLKTVRGAIEVNEHLARARNVSLSLDTDLSAFVSHDSLQLERALTNLIKNGIEAFDAVEGAKDARERLVRVSAKAVTPERILLSVEDSGPGLPYGTDSAFRLLRSTKTHGSGLGLFVARKIVEGHGGTIEARVSADLAGAAFLIELPVREGATV